MKRLIFPITFLISTGCYAQESADLEASYCQTATINTNSIPNQLKSHLGDWTSCELANYKETEFGVSSLTVISWANVTLHIKHRPPETSVYVVKLTGQSPLTADWYSQNQTKLVDEFFDMDWSFDQFPGPTAEHFLSPEVGTNAQFWTERDEEGNVTWMRFSYAL